MTWPGGQDPAMFEKFIKSIWELMIFPFAQLRAAFERRERQRETFLAQGLCSHCGEDPPLDGEDECYPCDERRSL